MEFKPIKTKKTYEEIVEQFKEMITSGVLKPGDRLPSERELAETMQVARSVVREAFRALEAIGVIDIRPGGGTFVKAADPRSIINDLSLMLFTGKESLRELVEVRKLLEIESAAMAAMRRTDEEIKIIKEIVDKMKGHQGPVEEGSLLDHKYHMAVCRATHNELLIQIMLSISTTVFRLIEIAREHTRHYHEFVRDHETILEAIIAQDSNTARETMRKHLEYLENAIKVTVD